jgi:hypothetical protein
VLEIKHNPVVGKKVAATYAFNTAFVSDNYKHFTVTLGELSPLSAVKSGIFEADFTLTMTFQKLCGCGQTFEYEKRCSLCKPYLSVERKKWELIYEIL